MHFDAQCNPSGLAMFLKDVIKRRIKAEPVFTFRDKKVFHGNSSISGLKRSIIKKKKEADRLQKVFHVEVLNDQKVKIISALKKIFTSKF